MSNHIVQSESGFTYLTLETFGKVAGSTMKKPTLPTGFGQSQVEKIPPKLADKDSAKTMKKVK